MIANGSKTYDVFVSHSSSDKAIAEKIARWLGSKDLKVWYDDWEILVGHDILDRVFDGIRNSRFLLVLLSKQSVESKWVQKEISAAMIREIESGATVVLPAIIEASAKPLIPEPLKTKRYADVAADFEAALSEIAYAVSVMKIGPASPQRATIIPRRPPGEGVRGYVLATVEVGKQGEVLNKLELLPEVKEAASVYGMFDVVTKVQAETLDELRRLVEKIRHIHSVRGTLFMIVTAPD